MPHETSVVFLLIVDDIRISTMALRELPSAVRQLTRRNVRSAPVSASQLTRRFASGEAAAVKEVSNDYKDLESQSTLVPSTAKVKVGEYDPIKRAAGRKRQLPSSRYGTIIADSKILGC